MKRPRVTIKFAQTLDGKIAAKDGSSKWISGPEALKFSHTLRSSHDAILVGIGTVLKDNPSLTTRRIRGRNPIRIVLDSRLRIPPGSQIIKDKSVQTIIVTSKNISTKKKKLVSRLGVECIRLSSIKGNINLKALIPVLYKKGIKSVLVEGGRDVITSFLKSGLVDRLIVIVSPKILGEGKSPIGDLGIKTLDKSVKLRFAGIKKSGKDIIYTAFFKE